MQLGQALRIQDVLKRADGYVSKDQAVCQAFRELQASQAASSTNFLRWVNSCRNLLLMGVVDGYIRQ